jgi:CBS domain-containing protein
MHDIVEFLRQLPPFEDLGQSRLESLAQAVEIEYFPSGTTIFHQGEGPMTHVRVIRSGTVELVDSGRVLDLLGEGELFGHPSMLSGLPAGFEARVGEDLLCYRIPADVALPLLSRPAGVRYVARSLLARPRPGTPNEAWELGPSARRLSQLVHDEPVICTPEATIREVVTAMAEAGSSAALIGTPSDGLGILTDHDLRQVIADGLAPDAPAADVMSFPAFTVTSERTGAEVILEMLDRGVRHVVVIAPFGDVLGVLTDADLLVADQQMPFALRREIDDATSVGALNAAAARLRERTVALHDAGAPPRHISGIATVVFDALTRRLIELAVDDLGPPPCPFTWLSLGSLGRREVMPSSDVDSALVWDGEEDDPEQREYMAAVGRRVVAGLGAGGFPADAYGATADQAIFDRSARSWRRLIRQAIDEPTEGKGLVLLSLLLDARTVERVGDAQDVLDELRQLRHRRSLVRLMLRLALAHHPPTGFLRDFVVAASGEHRGTLDIKHGGMLPIGSIARWASIATGARLTSTPGRLRVAAIAGILDPHDANAMTEAYDLFWRLRLEHQVEQLRQGDAPDNFLDPEALNPLTRTYLRDAFGAVRRVQRSLEGQLRHE